MTKHQNNMLWHLINMLIQMVKGYHYSNENGKEVYGRAADNHWMSVNGYNRVSDVIDAAAQEGAKQAANKFKGKLLTNEMVEENRKNIKSY